MVRFNRKVNRSNHYKMYHFMKLKKLKEAMTSGHWNQIKMRMCHLRSKWKRNRQKSNLTIHQFGMNQRQSKLGRLPMRKVQFNHCRISQKFKLRNHKQWQMIHMKKERS